MLNMAQASTQPFFPNRGGMGQFPNQQFGRPTQNFGGQFTPNQGQFMGTDMFGNPIFGQPNMGNMNIGMGVPQNQVFPNQQFQFNQMPQFNQNQLNMIAAFVKVFGDVMRPYANQFPCAIEDLQRGLTPNDPWCSITGLTKILEVANVTYERECQEGRHQYGSPTTATILKKAVETFWNMFGQNLLRHVMTRKQNEMMQQDQNINALMYGGAMPGVNMGIPYAAPMMPDGEGDSRLPNHITGGTKPARSQKAQEIMQRRTKGMEVMATSKNTLPLNKLTEEEENMLHQLNRWYFQRGLCNGNKSDECKTVSEKRELIGNWIQKLEDLSAKGLFVPTMDECKRYNLEKGKLYRESDRKQMEANYQQAQIELQQSKLDLQTLEDEARKNEFDTELAESHIGDVMYELECGVEFKGFGKCKNPDVDSLVTDISLTQGIQDIPDFMPQVEAVESASDTEEFTHLLNTRMLTVLPIPTETIERIKSQLKGKDPINLWKLGIEVAAKEAYGEIKPLFKFLANVFTDLVKRHIRMEDDLEAKITLEDFMDVEELLTHEFKRFARFPGLKERLVYLANKTVEMVLVDEDSLCTKTQHASDILRTTQATTLIVNGKFKDDVFFGTQEERDEWVNGFFTKYSVFRIPTKIALTNLIENSEEETVKLTRLNRNPKLLRLFSGLDFVADLKEQNEFHSPFGNIAKVIACEKGVDEEGIFVKPTSVMDVTNVTLMDETGLGKEVYLVPSGN